MSACVRACVGARVCVCVLSLSRSRVRGYARVRGLGACRSESVTRVDLSSSSHSRSLQRCARSLRCCHCCCCCCCCCGSCTRESCRCSRHSQDVSLSLCQCSDRATHLSTDALPVPRVEREEEEEEEVWRDGGDVVASRVPLPLARARSRIRPLRPFLCPPTARLLAASSLSLVRRLAPLYSRRLESLSG